MGKPSRRLRALFVGGLAVAAVMAAAPGSAAAKPGRSHDCTAGAAGIGDAYFPTYGNGGYDVRRYELDIGYDPGTDFLEGDAEIGARATESLCSFNLDFVGLEIDDVEVDGREARWTRDEHELTVTPRRPLDRGPFEVEVTYEGVPVEFEIPGFEIPAGFMTTEDGVTVAGQPEVATAWFPVNDHPRDKASYEFDVTVPAGYEVAANGFLVDRDRRRGSSTWEWVAREPMASYLATIDIGFWDVDRYRIGRLPAYDAVDPALTGGLRAEIDSSLARQDEVLDLLEGAFGEYPFSTVGAIVDNQDDLFFALETQTRPVYSKYFWLDSDGNPQNGDPVVVHELAHQWFGDDIAVHRWQDIWLNEGFATYAEWLWAEYEGQATPQEIFQALYDEIPAADEFWTVTIGDPGVESLFADPVYFRGAMTLQALRNEVGDDDFWSIVREWASSQAGGTATTEEFIALAEDVSGEQLDELFQTWLFTAEKPPPEAVASRSRAAKAPSAQAHAQAEEMLEDTRARLERGRY